MTLRIPYGPTRVDEFQFGTVLGWEGSVVVFFWGISVSPRWERVFLVCEGEGCRGTFIY